MTEHPSPSLRVLYVEDNALDADLVRRALERQLPGLRLDIVGTVAEARGRLAEKARDYDVVLVDLQLPDGSGFELLADIHERDLHLPVVMLTASGDQTTALAALKAGADDYVSKRGRYVDRLGPSLAAAAARQRARRTIHRHPVRVLFAEQNEIHVDRVRRHLARHAPQITLDVVASGVEVLARLPVSPDGVLPCDVVLLDDRLAGEDAFEVMKVVRIERSLDVPVVLVSEQDDEDLVFAAKRLGVSEYLEKNETYLDRLPAVLEKVHQEVLLQREHVREQELGERLRLYGVALESSREAVIITDLTPRILAVNPAFTRLTGYTEAEALGQNPNILRSGRQEPAFFRTMWESIKTVGFWEGEVWNRRKDGEVFPQWLSIHTVRDEAGDPSHYVALASDLSQLKHSEEKLRHLAHFDLLTDLPNRVLLEVRLEHALERARRHGLGHGVAVMVFDLDRFKTINDSLGHSAGDAVLQAVAERLRSRLRSEDTLARLVGDQFVVVMEGLADFRDAERMARELQTLLDEPFTLPGAREAYVSSSVGISVCPEDGDTAQVLLDKANTAAHRAKEMGGGQLSYYTGELNSQALTTLELEVALRRALERGEFVLYYQPKVDLVTGRISGAEALIRWERPGLGLVPPLKFIPLAERCGLIVPIGAWVVDEACRQLRAWMDDGMVHVNVAVNVSARQFRSGDLEGTVAAALKRHEVEPGRLMLELTESILMERPEEAVQHLVALKRLGVRLSLDDFGTGYSSLGYLSRFPIDQLKIDRSFVTDIVSDPSSAIIATSVIGLAHRMGIEVVAEGVETEPQLGYLRKNRCDKMQGYLFSKPVTADEFCEQLRQDKALPGMAQLSVTRTLLVVDDEPNILSAIRRLLRGEGYRVLTAGSAREGLEILASQPVQVILSDQRMPEMNGTEFLSRVKVLHPETVRIVLSGYTELESIMQAVNSGALYKFLTKPWDDEVLRGHLRDAFSYYEAVVQPNANGRMPGAAAE
ncbi:EAL domain-containing protein [Azoarcus sp. KH32C]|uniref:EAL domain-containing protein n=1 Tax=Azoarcus sp. KH32C TaxID=748247 RepID=UPI00023862DF|nr:EAL domain-containing protein [Azoarcus sp. KH32C]BAL25713.1 response regulator receiver modulated diguanylate cyclase/phosphodiesterase with PAS/PAC sensor [Azoarcus sp. KH32C]